MKTASYYDIEGRVLWIIVFLLLNTLGLVLAHPCVPVPMMDHLPDVIYEQVKDVADDQVRSMNSVNWPGVWY